MGLGNGEVGANRIESLNCKQHGTAARVARDYVTYIDKSESSPTVDRRFDVAKIDIHLSRRRCRFGLVRVGLSRVEVLRRDNIAGAQFLLPLLRNLIQRCLRFRLLESRLLLSRMNWEKQIAFLYLCPLLTVASNYLSTH